MDNSRKQKLIDLGPETLAEALLDIATHYDPADELVERLIATPEDNVKRFRNKLAGLKRSRRFIDWREVSDFARGLKIMLQDLEAGVTDPLTGVELVAAFFEMDEKTLGRSDDSSGLVGDVFRYDARKLFVEYASRCTDKERIADILLKLNLHDDFGVRDTLINGAGEYLPESIIRSMIHKFQEMADKEKNEYVKWHYLHLIESLARQIRDAKLFEQTRIAARDKLSNNAFIDIAQVYLESGDIETAYEWIMKVPEGETFKGYERDKLLMEIYRKRGDKEHLAELLYQQFRSRRSLNTLQELLDVIGEEKREKIIAEEVAFIMGCADFSEIDAEFLISIGKLDETEEYLLERAEKLNGEFYGRLLPLARSMESEKRNLASSILYRSLLVSILDRKYARAYNHGARYLRKLDELAESITDWKSFEDHEKFKEYTMKAHGRKKSFWMRYEEKK